MGPLWTIRVETWIDAPVERCFEVALRVESHGGGEVIERVVDLPVGGRLKEGDQLTRESRHFGKKIRYTTRIDEVRPYSYFREARVSGALSRYDHEHHFAMMDDGTRMRDEIRFAVPMGGLGRLATKMFVRRRLAVLLRARSQEIKRLAESDAWNQIGKAEEPILKAAETAGEKKAAQHTEPEKEWAGRSMLRGSEKFS